MLTEEGNMGRGCWALLNVHESIWKMIEKKTQIGRDRSGLECRAWGGGRFGGKMEREKLVECEDCGFLYQYSASAAELQGLQAAVFSVLLHLSHTYTCTWVCPQTQGESSTPGCVHASTKTNWIHGRYINRELHCDEIPRSWIILYHCKGGQLIKNPMEEDVVLAVWASWIIMEMRSAWMVLWMLAK